MKKRKKQEEEETKEEKGEVTENSEEKKMQEAWKMLENRLSEVGQGIQRAKKWEKLNRLSTEIMALLEKESEEAESKAQNAYMGKLKQMYGKDKAYKKYLAPIRKNMSDIHVVRLLVHGKHGSQFWCPTLWYKWNGLQVVWCQSKCNFSGDITSGFLAKETGYGDFPLDELDIYTKKWGFCALPADLLEHEERVKSLVADEEDCLLPPVSLIPIILTLKEEAQDLFF